MSKTAEYIEAFLDRFNELLPEGSTGECFISKSKDEILTARLAVSFHGSEYKTRWHMTKEAIELYQHRPENLARVHVELILSYLLESSKL